ncbi:MAG: hypothetical protein IPK19_29880 [Chloroflexi bacterium]|nr:hypothetical protein [Chloroflexota bacterium]
MIMPAREQFFSDLSGEADLGMLLLTQMGGAPNEIHAIVETAEYDAEANGLRPKGGYAVRALGVIEHRVHLGMFEHARLCENADHPLLYHHNTPRVAVHFDGTAKDVNELALDISQAYVSTFLNWRHLVDHADDINRALPLIDLLQRGYGLLGTMPRPLAERMGRVLAHHGIGVSLSEDVSFATQDEHGRSRLAKLLLLDEAYFIAFDFSFERMGQRSE